METRTKTIDLIEEIWTEILARLPLKIIARCKSVSKSWKSTIESVYFRRLYVSLHQKSSPSWLLKGWGYELIGFHGCESRELRKSFFIPPSWLQVIVASSNGLVLISGYDQYDFCVVGNPILKQWINTFPPPARSTFAFGLVTRVDEDGFLLGFKVVRLDEIRETNDNISVSSVFNVFVYSSETGIWSSKKIQCPYKITNPTTLTLTLNGTIYYSHHIEPRVLVAYDFYSESSDQFRVISLPDQPNDIYKSSLTSSGGFFMYIRAFVQSSHNVVKVWRLNNDDTWQLLWNISLPLLIGEYIIPMAMHPFDSDIVYLWSQRESSWSSGHVVSCNLRKQKNRILRDAGNDDDDDDHQGCFMNRLICSNFMDGIRNCKFSVGLLQLVLPQWLESVPCPPQAEIIDTTSLLSYMSSMYEEIWKDRVEYETCYQY